MRAAWDPACSPTEIVELVPGIRLAVDPRAIEAWDAFGNVLQAEGYNVRAADTGSYNCRRITGGSGWSLHAYGIAVDLNWRTNPYLRDRLVTDMPEGLVARLEAIRTKEGDGVFRWGGHFKPYRDPMHWEIVVTPDELEAGIDWSTVERPERDPARPDTWPVLRRGSKGPTVVDLQERLARLRLYRAAIDGDFGPKTEKAVLAFQRARGLTPDGWVGVATWTLLLAGVDDPGVALPGTCGGGVE